MTDDTSRTREAEPGSEHEMPLRAQDRESEPPGGQATSAGGGYGIGSASGSGGSGEATEPAGDDAETAWLRDAPGGRADGGNRR